MTTALFIGRFQPMHKAHLQIVRRILEQNDRLAIGIGSANSKDKDNPFTGEERKIMVEKALQQEMIHYYNVFLIPDINDNERWVEHVKDIVGEFDKVYTMNPLVKELFESADIEVVWLEGIYGFSSTEVRKRIIEDGNWRELVPNIIALELERIDGIERIKTC